MQEQSLTRQQDGRVFGMATGLIGLVEKLPHWPLQLLARLTIATIFWRSGRTKVDGVMSITDSTFFLFEAEYNVPIITPVLAAYLATFAEHLFPILLVAGLATRVSALALLIMTLVIQTFVYPDAYLTHGLWAIALLYLVLKGGGLISLDHLIRRRFMG